jgi:heme a synthase
MNRSEPNPRLSGYAVFVAINTLLLIAMGGLVTSKGVGMSVPDWPTTYGQNMFLYPFSKWTGGVFYEHTHRLMGSWVGLLTLALAFWIWLKEPRAWLRRLGWTALAMVCLQGLLGGLRVTLFKDEIGIFHAALAQSFFVLLCLIALATSGLWRRVQPSRTAGTLVRYYALGVGLVFLQLVLGATMRHQHAGLAIPDFPLAYGQLWPSTHPLTLQTINLAHADHSITAFQIYLHMFHRVGALVLLVVSVWITRKTLISMSPRSRLGKATVLWQVMIVGQALLGAATVWTGKQPMTATLHVVLGTCCLTGAALLTVAAKRKRWLVRPEASVADSIRRLLRTDVVPVAKTVTPVS